MTVLVSRTHRCDARCQHAEGEECTCVCGGRNHGRGEDIAAQNAELFGEQLVEAFEARQREEHHKELLERDFDSGQRWLFGEVG